MNTRKLIVIVWAVLITSGLPLSATDYFNPADYQYNMTITGTILIENIENSELDTLFAYAGEQCRGLISPKYESGYGKWFVYLVVHGNGESEEITFKYYNETKDSIIDLCNTMIFEIDRIHGTPGYPYKFSDIEVSVNNHFSEPWIVLNQYENLLVIDLNQQAYLEVIDLSGKIILHKGLSYGRSEIFLEGFKKNIYILRISSQREILTRKILF
ncbi:MAG: hypothetical protein AMS27_17850 [Bacteroides sp. SM23_62_1]|nr:MAG: hypothetical protein AMS27_17850 [Bacteroides sp. SM23_62_1]